MLLIEGLITDINESQKTEAEINLLQTLSSVLRDAQDFDSALEVALRQVCQATSWEFGEGWVKNESKTYLKSHTKWYAQSKRNSKLKKFREQSISYTFAPNVGLPGKVWSSRKPKWIQDVSEEPMFLRGAIAKECGLKAGLGVPIIANDEVVAVLVFFMSHASPQERRLLDLVVAVASQLGIIIQHKITATELQESKRELASLINAIPGLFFRVNINSKWSKNYLSAGCYELTGFTLEELIVEGSISFKKITHPQDLPRVIEKIQESIENQKPYVVEYRICTKSGEEKWVWEKGHGVFGEDGMVLGIEGFVTEITQRKQMEESLRDSEEKYRSIFENAMEGIFQTTPDGNYLSANPALARIYGYTCPEELMRSLKDIEHQLYVVPGRRAELINLLQKNDVVADFESQVYRQDGRIIWIAENCRAVRNLTGDLLYYEGTVEDITYQMKTKEQLHMRAYYDSLTGLPNRTLFMEMLGKTLARARNEVCKFAILFLDLDRFKVVNDSLGHLVGDELLVAIAQRLCRRIPQGLKKCLAQNQTISRLGGDEFIILIEGVANLPEVLEVADLIQQELNQPFSLTNRQVFASVSMGIVFQDSLIGSSITPEELLRNADLALYRAKAISPGGYQVFDETMHQKVMAALELETDLRHAIAKKQFELNYQPIVCLTTGKLKGFEALLRWRHPRKGMISPDQFIPMAEETGLIIPMGLWVLKKACYQLREWLPQNPNLTMSVNLSVPQFSMPDLIEQVDRVLQEVGLNPRNLRLEITESCCMQNKSWATEKLAQLKERKIELCIDDFGTGYSCLSYLHQLPIQVIKIDRSFVNEIEQDTSLGKIGKAVLMLIKALGHEAIAEGIETLSQVEQLRAAGCQFGQGYFFSKPLNSEAATAFINSVDS